MACKDCNEEMRLQLIGCLKEVLKVLEDPSTGRVLVAEAGCELSCEIGDLLGTVAEFGEQMRERPAPEVTAYGALHGDDEPCPQGHRDEDLDFFERHAQIEG